MSTEAIPARFGSGQAVPRIEDKGLLRGEGRYTDDFTLENQAVCVFLRSPHAHARIRSVDKSAAEAMPGVIGVFSGADLAAAGVKPLPGAAGAWARGDGKPAVSGPRHPIAVDKAHYVGEAVCMIIAESRTAALDAAEAVEIDYETLPAVTTVDAALAADAPRVADGAPDNICAEMRHGDAAKADAAFAKAAHVVSVDLDNQRLAPASIEPRSVLAYMDGGRLTIRMSTQMPTGVRGTLAEPVLGMKPEDIRVVVGDVGGGFGMKTGMYPEDGAVAFAAKTLNRPVRWIADRSEDMLSAVHGRDVRTRAEMAFDGNGKILAYRLRSDANVGGCANPTGVAIQLLIGPWVATSIYDITLIDFHLRAILTNTAPTAAYRGAGRPEAIYFTERLMDEAARQLGIDPRELRRRNMIRPEQMPYKNQMAQTYDTGAFESVMNQGLELADWDGYEKRAADSLARGLLRGRGIATFLEWTGGNAFEERVTVNITADGIVEVMTALMPMGQGIATSFAQVVVDTLGLPIEKIRILHGDTDRANGFGSAGSRSIFTGGSAVEVASERTIDKAKELAAEELECAPTDIEYVAPRLQVMGTDRGIDLFELAGKQEGGKIFVDSTSSVIGPTWPNGCHICEVEIDPDTGHVQIVSYANVNDVGRVINPMIVVGQLEGGAVQGIGQALCEQVVYDEDGQLQTGSFMDYAMPRADIYGTFKTTMDQSVPSTNNRLGVKGVGELGTIGATPAVVSAVMDALVRAGVSDERRLSLQMPVTSEKVWALLNG
ncbi:MAG: xanthine dehydrogenase family protein molybdopterin-binding subunit [Burkholderiaceae bacterium]